MFTAQWVSWMRLLYHRIADLCSPVSTDSVTSHEARLRGVQRHSVNKVSQDGERKELRGPTP